MLRAYSDITSRLGPPLWWDDQGVPRYDLFSPTMCGLYDRKIALLEVACTACEQEFTVAISFSYFFDSPESPANPDPTDPDTLTYWLTGYPPRHQDSDHTGCVGEIMEPVMLRIVGFWVYDKDDPDRWRRLPECEFVFPSDQAVAT